MSHDDADPDNDPALQSLRSVWLSMPDEEPPARGLADLMAAARIKAEEMAQPSLWERFVALLRRPPVLALATVMILVGGVVIIGQRGDQMEAQPSATRQAPSDEALDRAPEPQVAIGGAPQGTGEAAGSAAAAPTAPAIGAAADDVASARPDPSSSGDVTTGAPVKRRPEKLVAPATAKVPAEKKAENKAKLGARDRAFDPFDGDSAMLAEENDQEKEEAKADRGDAVTTKSTSAPRPEGGARPSTTQLHAQARGAAARGDCASARAFAQQLAKLDAAYYRAKVAKDAALAACLAQ